MLLKKCSICVVFVTSGRLQEVEGKMCSEVLMTEACGFRSVAFIIHISRKLPF